MTDVRKRITALQELETIEGDAFVMVDNATSGAKKYNLKALSDAVAELTDGYEEAEAARDEAYAQAEEDRDAAAAALMSIVDGVPNMVYYEEV
jgi:uncharacterized protein (DUF1330 family)